MSKKLQGCIKLAVSVIGIGAIVLIFRNRFDEVIGILAQCKLRYVFMSIGLYLLVTFFPSLRLKLVLATQKVYLSVFQCWKLTFIGYFFNMFLPSSIGGDVVKIYYAYKYSNQKERSFIGVLVDRIVGFFSLIILCSVALVLFSDQINNPRVFVVIGCFLLMGAVLILVFSNKNVADKFACFKSFIPSEKIRSKISQLYLLVHACRNHKRTLVSALGISLFFQTIVIFGTYLLSIALSLNLPLTIFYFLTPLIFVFSLFPSINGLGVREGTFIYFFSFFTSSEHAFALSLLGDVVIYSAGIIGFFVYIMSGKIKYNEIKSSHLEDISVKEGDVQ